MGSSWSRFSSRCKSRLSALARSCFLGREHWLRKYREAKRAEEECLEKLANGEARYLQLEQKYQEVCQQNSELQAERAKPRPIQLPWGDVPPGQQYGDNMIALSVNLGRKLGPRRAKRALKIFRLVGNRRTGPDT